MFVHGLFYSLVGFATDFHELNVDTTFAIIGTAGRKNDALLLKREHFTEMCDVARTLIKQIRDTNYGADTLVSGGAAWADHVAVKLFLLKEFPKLKLFFPCSYIPEAMMFDVAPLGPYEVARGYTTGGIINAYHKKFTTVVGFNSLHEIRNAIQRGAEVVVPNGGFYGRNALVAQSDIILAMTFGENEWLKDGGTANTMLNYLKRVKKYGFFDKSFHYDLNTKKLFAGAKVRPNEENK